MGFPPWREALIPSVPAALCTLRRCFSVVTAAWHLPPRSHLRAGVFLEERRCAAPQHGAYPQSILAGGGGCRSRGLRGGGRPSRARCVALCGGGRAGRVSDQCHDFLLALEQCQSTAEGSRLLLVPNWLGTIHTHPHGHAHKQARTHARPPRTLAPASPLRAGGEDELRGRRLHWMAH